MPPDNINNEATNPNEETEAEKPDVTEDKATESEEAGEDQAEEKDLPFNKHPRWKEMQTKLGEMNDANAQLVNDLTELKGMVARLSKDSQGDAADEILAELEKMDTNRPNSYKELFQKYRELSKKADARDQERSTKEAEAANAATVKDLQDQLVELVQLEELEDAEIKPFADWCAEKLNSGAPRSIYSNFHAALPKYRAMQAETAKTKEEQAAKKSRSGVGASGASDSEMVKIASKDLKGMSMEEAMKRSAASKK
jgi:alanyl-tRNA synthetase